MKNDFSFLGLATRGMAMGIAEVIPGVSGGTIAFITGIYAKLINTIKAFGPKLLPVFKKEGIKGVWEAVNGNFLVGLLTGMVAGIVVGVLGVSHLLENYPLLLWSFFFGLIISSAIYIGRQVGKWGAKEVLALILGTIVAYSITVMSPAEGNMSLWFIFIAGSIAISALILPGISGSFILLLMGVYKGIFLHVKKALTTFDPESLTVMLTFSLGCVVGLFTFSRLLSWTFKNYESITLALLTGFMIGSLNKLWPWRNVLSYRENSSGEKVPFLEQSVLPGNFDGDPQVIAVLVLMVIGFISVFAIEKLGNKK